MTRLLAALVCALALGLLAWRGAALLTVQGGPGSASPTEDALAGIISPIAGPGLSRLSVTYNAEGGRTVLILLDERASARIPELERIAPLAAGIIPESGDRLVIETVAFAEGVPGRPDINAWIELAGLAAMALVGGILVVVSGRPGAVHAPAAQLMPVAAPASDRAADAPRPLRAAPVAASTDAAVEIVRRDPARAASVVRGWMNTKDEIA